MFTWLQSESRVGHSRSKAFGIQTELVAGPRTTLNEIEGFERTRNNGRCDSVGEEIWTRPLTQHIDDLLASGEECVRRFGLPRPLVTGERLERQRRAIHDLHAPGVDAAAGLLDDLVMRVRRGEHLLVHCAAGIGRAGTIAACVLVRLGMHVDAALAHVAAHRPMAGPQAPEQLELIEAVAARMR